MVTRNDPSVVEDSNLSFAWGKAFKLALTRPQANPAPMVVSVTDFDDDLPTEDSRIRSALDAALAAADKNSCAVSAMIVFPFDDWERQGRPNCQQFSEWCLGKFIPRLKERDKRNRKGLYFERMMNFHGGADSAKRGKNQLLHLVEWWQEQRDHGRARPPRSRLQLSCFDPFADHNRECRPYFPCLQQVSFGYDDEDGLTLNAFYPTQYLFDRAYGNYLGLCHLGAFMASQLGLHLVRFNCFISRAELGGTGKEELAPLRELLDEILPEVEVSDETA